MKYLLVPSILLVSLLNQTPALQANLVISFEDIYDDLGYNADPVTYYQVTHGVTFGGTYDGIRDGVSAGDSGIRGLEGTNGHAYLASSNDLTVDFAGTVDDITFDVGNSFGSNVSYTAQSRLNGVLVQTFNFSVLDNFNGNGTWHTVTFGDPFDQFSVSGGGGQFGFDNVTGITAVPEPSSLILCTICAIGFFVHLKWTPSIGRTIVNCFVLRFSNRQLPATFR